MVGQVTVDVKDFWRTHFVEKFQEREEARALCLFYDNKSGTEKLSEKFTIFEPSFNIKKMLHDFNLAGKRMRLWQRTGESYEHILMKALGYAMFAPRYPNLEIETK